MQTIFPEIKIIYVNSINIIFSFETQKKFHLRVADGICFGNVILKEFGENSFKTASEKDYLAALSFLASCAFLRFALFLCIMPFAQEVSTLDTASL